MLKRLALLLSILGVCAPAQAEEVARYDGGVITAQDIARHAQVIGMPQGPEGLQQQRALARELVLTRLLAKQAIAAGLAASEEFQRLWRVERQALLAQQLQVQQGLALYRAPERFYRLQSLLVRARLPNGLRLRSDEEAVAIAERLRQALVQGALEMSGALGWEGVESEVPAAQPYLLSQSLAPTSIRWALERQAAPAPARLWRLRHHTPLYLTPDPAAPVPTRLERFMIVSSRSASAPSGWQAVRYADWHGYVPSELLEPLGEEVGYSQLIHTAEGVLILRLLGSEQHTPDSYRSHLQTSRFHGAPEAAAQAARVQEDTWLKLNARRWEQWYRGRYAELGLRYGPEPTLPSATAESLHVHQDFVLTRPQLDDYLQWLAHHQARRGIEPQPFDAALYGRFVQQAVLAHAARRQGLHLTETVHQRERWQKQQLLAALYRQRFWPPGGESGAVREAELLQRHGYRTP
jgi:hypothetical protein